MRRMALLAVVVSTTAASALPIIIRPDVPDTAYVVPDSAFAPLADLPMEAHGVLIDERWVVTVGHATRMMTTMPDHDYVVVGGLRREVADVVLYPGFVEEYRVFDDAIRRFVDGTLTGDAAPFVEIAASVHDMALLRLSEPVEDVTPVALYRNADEEGRIVEIYGKGATGNGRIGQYEDSPHRGVLRRAQNRITSADGHWLIYRFDCDAKALPLEGASGSGDSGGPLLIRQDGEWKLAGLTAQGRWEGDLADYRAGVCGQNFAASRISWFAGWIDSVMATHR